MSFIRKTRQMYLQHKDRAAAGVVLDYSLTQLRALVREALDTGRCRHCGGPLAENFSVDHANPVSRAGSFRFDNLMVCCRSCNLAKGPLNEYEFHNLTLLIRNWPDPAARNLLAHPEGRWAGGWCWGCELACKHDGTIVSQVVKSPCGAQRRTPGRTDHIRFSEELVFKAPPPQTARRASTTYRKAVEVCQKTRYRLGTNDGQVGAFRRNRPSQRANPRLLEVREQVKRKAREQRYGADVVIEESKWNEFAESTEYMLAVYRKGKGVVVDVLRVNEAFIDNKGKVKLGVAAPKVVRDRDIGNYLEWEKDFELSLARLLYHEGLHSEFFRDGLDEYRRVVEKGLSIAREM